MSFNDYIDLNYNDKLDELTKLLISDAYEAGASSRQTEIDELQKRIDDACKVMKMYGQDGFVYKILKGQNNG